MSTLVLVPSRGRPKAAHETLASFLETRRDPDSRIVFLVDATDPTRSEYPAGTRSVVGGSLGNVLREAAHDAGLLGHATSVGAIGDDVRFRTPWWDLVLDGWLTQTTGIAWGDDGWDHPWPKEEKASHWWLSREIVDAMGLCPPTQHFYMDDYWAQLGWAVGCARYFGHILIEHLHPLAGKAETDPTYERARRFVGRDKLWWRNWQTSGKLTDTRRLRAITSTERLRVFADWHHPSLWESLSILFEDRFGWELYSPIGTNWKYHGWHLSGATPGWTADDYLDFPDARLVNGHHELTEPEYPRLRKLVTPEQFEAQRWDIVIASVGAHQRSFAKLAKSKGARFVHHVGDAKRRIDRIPGRVILASANVRATVTHHQEFDLSVFAYSPPTDPTAVSSLMLRLDSTSGPYKWLSEAEGVKWSAVRCEAMRGPGYVAPMSAVADRIRESGWIWHDKRIGDGFGHVLFAAAAMGRPLIGHASYYRGLMGESLWEDGVTCLSLDDRTPDEALAMWRGISPERHAEMSAAIRARFDELVDFDADAEAVKRALTA